MIRYLIKNNFKLMLRNKWNLIILVLGPVLIIMALSAAFAELMKSYEGVDEFSAGYRVSKDFVMYEHMDEIKEAGNKSGIDLYEYPEGKPEEIIANNKLAGFVEFTGDSYVLYKSGDYEVEGLTLEYFVSRIMDEGLRGVLQGIAAETGGIDAMGSVSEVNMLPEEELSYMPAVDSTDYYGIVYIVYFCWCGMVCATGVLSNEKKYGIGKKFQVSIQSELKLYISRLLPTVSVVTVGMGIATGTTILLYGIHWGNALLSALVVFMMILAGVSFGLMLYYLSDNMAITVIVLFTVVWFMGFFGGSFETYMYSSSSDTLKQLSPLYHGNRALVELSCMGHSSYVNSAVIYSLIITFGCSVVSVVAGKLRRRGRA